MVKICASCGKRAMSGNNVSHSHRKTKRLHSVNLQLKKDAHGQRVLLCTGCIKASGK
jgi:large subunit ribosomal protein L28